MLDRRPSHEVDAVRAVAHPLGTTARDYDPLLELVGEARFVLIGEASHGTHEFYRERAAITRRLIQEKGFHAVAVEADWPDAYRVNRFVRGVGDDRAAVEALGGFQRFPSWMWRNADVLDFVAWLRSHNETRVADAPEVGFYGLDLYSLYGSIAAVIDYLEKVDPAAAVRARQRYACFQDARADPQLYGYAAAAGAIEPCEADVVAQLVELQRRAAELIGRDGRLAEDEFFFAEQNARLAKNAEAYYRSMFRGRHESWNLRDRHMAETLDALVLHLERRGDPAKVVIWAHNSHLGDARATEMGESGELNLGQLVRERHAATTTLVGFSTHRGTVTAASDWDAPAERKRVRPALPESYEALFHEVGIPRFLLVLRDGSATVLRSPRLQRAIGVIYSPETERFSHYFYASLPQQFDALIHIDETRAVEPLESGGDWSDREPPETFPSGI